MVARRNTQKVIISGSILGITIGAIINMIIWGLFNNRTAGSVVEYIAVGIIAGIFCMIVLLLLNHANSFPNKYKWKTK